MKKGIRYFFVIGLCLVFVANLVACGTFGEDNWGEWVTTLASTCEHEGEQMRVSKTDPLVKEYRTIAPNGHSWKDWHVTTSPTCLVEGVESRECEHCDNIDVKSINANGHAWGAWEITLHPTCTTTGVKTAVCKNDGTHTWVQNIDTIDTLWEEWEITLMPTCENVGIESRVCKSGDGCIEQREIPALGHDYSEAVVTTAPTCETNGQRTSYCRNDNNHVITSVVYAYGHDYSDWVLKDSSGSQEIRICKNHLEHVETRDLHSNFIYELKEDGYEIRARNNNLSGIITIPSYYQGKEVLYIANDGFSNNSNITKVVFEPDSVLRTIGERAFMNCDSLFEIEFIPHSITHIGAQAFMYCTSLQRIILPTGLMFIEPETFAYCTSLYNVFITSQLRHIMSKAFYQCTQLREIELPSSILNIDDGAFYNCTQLRVDLMDLHMLGFIMPEAFANAKINKIMLNSSITHVGFGAFAGWTSEQVIIVQGLTQQQADQAWGVQWRENTNATIQYIA